MRWPNDVLVGQRKRAGLLLGRPRSVHGVMEQGGFAALLPEVNAFWRLPRRVELELDHRRVAGWFQGVDALGRMALGEGDRLDWFDPVEVVQVREND